MSTADHDEDLKKLLENLDFEDITDEVSVQSLTPEDLITKYHYVTQQLLKRGEVVSPKSQEGRDLHSQRGAYTVELRRRGMM